MANYFSNHIRVLQEEKLASVLGYEFLSSKAMTRLKGIAFLGVLHTVAGIPESMKFTRYDHSISVAYLTWLYCKNLKIPRRQALIATLFALIHDAGHPPFSHSTEIYLRIRQGYNFSHTSVLIPSKIRKMIKDYFNSLPPELKEGGLEELVNTLHEFGYRKKREDYHNALYNIFDSPFCPDTFDGVNRAWCALSSKDILERLKLRGFIPVNPMNPIDIVNLVSSSGLPLVVKSHDQPTNSHPIYSFHSRMETLYKNVIYAHWQLSSMVIFARALEIAYEAEEKFEFTLLEDKDVINKINSKERSKKLYEKLLYGEPYKLAIRNNNPSLYRKAWDTYLSEKEKKNSYAGIKTAIELMVANKMGVPSESIYCLIFNPLIWSERHIRFSEFDRQKNDLDLWQIVWHKNDGEPTFKPHIEIYYSD